MPDCRGSDFTGFNIHSGYRERRRLLSHTALATTIMLGGLVLAGPAVAEDVTGGPGANGTGTLSTPFPPELIETEGAGISVSKVTGPATGRNGDPGNPGTGEPGVDPAESSNGTGGAGGSGGGGRSGGIGALDIILNETVDNALSITLATGAATGGNGGAGGDGTGGTGGPGGDANGTGGAGGAGGNATGGGIGAVTIDVTGNVISATMVELTGGAASGGAGGAGGDGTGGTGGIRGGAPGGDANGLGGIGGAGGNAIGGGVDAVTIDVTGAINSATTLEMTGGLATGGAGGAGGTGTGGTGGGGGGSMIGGAGGSADGTGGDGGSGGSAVGGSVGLVSLTVGGDIGAGVDISRSGGDATGGAGGTGGNGTGGSGDKGGGDGGGGLIGGAGGPADGTGGDGGSGGSATGGSVGQISLTVGGDIGAGVNISSSGGDVRGGRGGTGGNGTGGAGGAGSAGGGAGAGAGGSADGLGGAGGSGGDATGGNAGSVSIVVGGDIATALDVSSSGGDATGGAGGTGGNGTGGIGGSGSVTGGDAKGYGGAGGAGGSAAGGNSGPIIIAVDGDIGTGVDISSSGGNARGGAGGSGGSGNGGTTAGTVSGSVFGAGGSGGAGGSATGGDAGEIAITLGGRTANGVAITATGGVAIGGAGGDGKSGDNENGVGGAGGDAEGGDADVTLTNTGDITNSSGNAVTVVAEAGDATGGAGGAGGDATGGDGTGGKATVEVTNAGAISGTGNGLDITATAGSGTGGAADTFVLNGTGTNGSSSITVGNSGVVDVDGIGVKALAKGDNGTIQINNTGGTITGGAGGVVVATDLSFAGNSDIDIVNSGLITSGDLLAAAAIDAKGASAELRNAGTVLGFIDLTELDDTFDNEAGGVFAARGTSDFRGGVDQVNNAGTVHTAGDPSAAEDVVFDDLDGFSNSGWISLVDGQEGDSFTLKGTAYESTGGRLAVDAQLGPSGKSDLLIFDGVGASTNGVTRVSVNVTGVSGANTDGITVVEAINGATTHDGDFALDGGVLNAGFFAWGLRPDGDTFELFTSGVGTGAYEFAAGITGMQDIWYQTTGTLLQRQADLRPLLGGTQVTPVADYSEPVAPTPAGQIGPGFWIKGVGAWLERDQDNDTDRKQSIYGGLAGFDFATEGAGDVWLFGLYGGYLGSKLKFNETNTEWTYDGPTVGAYATYLNEALYVDMLVKADFLSISIDPDDVAPNTDDEDTDGINLGGLIDGGYKFGSGEGLFIEPQATLAVLYTSIDDVDIYGGNVDFEDETSVRGRLGLRLGYDHTAANAVVYSSDVTASVWQEFNGGDNDVSITTPDFPAFGVSDEPGKTVGDISLGFSVMAPDGWSGFLRGNYQFSDDLDAIAGSAGVRYSW